ncbi:hypothetical protein GPECTOR_36g36 [Gonium pectorale]|uniref:Uncharacterized protein n=1 Tax=Gonium pectorale TaxID=33097 RepID=A0A150GBS9_GONPE|nr:hypothetical protein GPECTOR_36g36 [Gonium pectorale]|eukprot:KXZ47311.1 hypothetical protein GPECTOR_36g36 [Gonium pectorale]
MSEGGNDGQDEDSLHRSDGEVCAASSADGGCDSNVPGSDGEAGDERPVDSDREVVEEEDAFGDFADFTSASRFMPGGGLGAAGASSSVLPPPSASAAAAARAGGPGASSSSSPSSHRHSHYSSGFSSRPAFGALSAGAPFHAAPASTTASEPGSFGGDFSDFHASPPPSVAPSRAGGGRKSVASLASVGSRAGGDDDVGDYGSVVGSSVWRAPSQMATSSYAAAAGADDDFGDFTSDITSQSDFAPSTQPPSAVAVSGPGSVHPDDDFGSFASHRSNADDDDDDFGNFAAAPAAAGAGSGAAGAAAGGSGAGAAAGAGVAAGPSASGPQSPAAGPQGGNSGAMGPGAFSSGAAQAATAAASAAQSPGSSLPSPRDAAQGASTSHPYHSTQSVGPAAQPVGSGDAAVAHASEASLLHLPPEELRSTVAKALQPLLPPGSALLPLPGLVQAALPEEQVAAAWAQLRRHVTGTLVDGVVVANTGIPIPSLPGGPEAADAVGQGDGRAGYMPAFKFSRPLRWKGSESERRLLASLGLTELAAQARAAEAAEAPSRPVRSRSERPGSRPLGRLASFGDAPRRPNNEPVHAAALSMDGEAGGDVASATGGSGDHLGSRTRGLESDAAAAGPLSESGAAAGASPRAANGSAKPGHTAADAQNGSEQAK